MNYLVTNTLPQDWADSNPEIAKNKGLVLNVNWKNDLPIHLKTSYLPKEQL